MLVGRAWVYLEQIVVRESSEKLARLRVLIFGWGFSGSLVDRSLRIHVIVGVLCDKRCLPQNWAESLALTTLTHHLCL